MIILIAETFGVSLDELILGDKKMNKIEQTLINDGKRSRAAKFNMVTTIIGSAFIILGIIFFLISGASVSYIDSNGFYTKTFLNSIRLSFIICRDIDHYCPGNKLIHLAIKERKNN